MSEWVQEQVVEYMKADAGYDLGDRSEFYSCNKTHFEDTRTRPAAAAVTEIRANEGLKLGSSLTCIVKSILSVWIGFS